jgi:hypothetical protein
LKPSGRNARTEMKDNVRSKHLGKENKSKEKRIGDSAEEKTIKSSATNREKGTTLRDRKLEGRL